MAAATPVLGQFLVAINGFVQVRNERELASYFALEPPFGDLYVRMQEELRRVFPAGQETALEERCARALPAATKGDEDEGISPWSAFVKFVVQYLGYLRDVTANVDQLLQTYQRLSELQQRANSALNHAELGHLVLPVVEANARLVCRLAIGLDKRPELIANARAGGPATAGEDSGPRETLPERAANTLRQAFVTCLNDRNSGLTADGRPEGKKRGIYTIANLCLKILFQCRKTRNATQIFDNIYHLSPPLAAYPKRQRVTYLYYLGRFLFSHAHFHRAQRALQAAYDECPTRPDCIRQRRHILIYLIASNIILGRFPSSPLLSRPEAQGLADKFLPICHAIRSGDLASFNQHLAHDGPHAPWFLHFRLLLPLRHRAQVLVWRSLVRKVWIINGTRPSLESRVTPQVDVGDLVVAFAWLERRQNQHLTKSREEYIDADLDTSDQDIGDADEIPIDSIAIESKLSSLIDQGLLAGFIAHGRGKFAITGVKHTGGDILAAGFPRPWDVLRMKGERVDGEEVPGWKRRAPVGGGGGGFGPGMVVNFSGLRPIGAVG